MRCRNRREPSLQHANHGSGVVDRKRGLRNESQIVRIFDTDRFCILRRFNQANRSIRQLAHCANDFGVARMADQKNIAPCISVFLSFDVNFGNERAGRVDINHLARRCFGGHRFRHAMGGKNDWSVIRALIQFFNEHGAFSLQAFDNMGIMNNFVAHINGRPPFSQRLFDDLNGTVYASAESTRGREADRQ